MPKIETARHEAEPEGGTGVGLFGLHFRFCCGTLYSRAGEAFPRGGDNASRCRASS